MTKRGPGRPRKRGRPRKAPGAPVEHRLTPKVKAAIEVMVANNLTMKEAAEASGVTANWLYKAVRHQAAMTFYAAEVKALQTCAKHQAWHALIKELTGDNAAARVAAARVIVADDDKKPTAQGMPQAPGFVFMVVDRGTPGQALPNGHAAPPMIEARPVEAEH